MVRILLILLVLLKSMDLKAHTLYVLDDMISPAKEVIEKDNLKYTYITLGITAGLFLIDNRVKDISKNSHTKFMTDFFKYPKYMGDGYSISGVGLLTIAGGFINEDKRLVSFGSYICEGVIISGVYETFVKFLFGRARPYTRKTPFTFHPFHFSTAYTSFYSGHTTEAFTFATIISQYFKNKVVSLITYSIATLTGIERVYNNKHWISDVFLGAVIGVIIGKSIIENNTDYFYNWKSDFSGFKISFYSKKF